MEAEWLPAFSLLSLISLAFASLWLQARSLPALLSVWVVLAEQPYFTLTALF